MFKKKFLALGADPEVFFLKPDGTGQSVEGLLPGTKEFPSPMVGLNTGFNIQVDNVAAEFNIPPAQTREQWDRNLMLGLKYVATQARRHKCKLGLTDVMTFPKAQLETEHAQTLGCEPDFNIWEGEMNPRPQPPDGWRTAAAHVHISWTEPDEPSAFIIGRMADLFLGVPSLLVTQPSKRRELYGKSGAWRFKPYGGEYRALPNWWIGTKENRLAVWDHVQQGFSRLHKEQDHLIEMMEEFKPEIQHAINTHNLDSALMLIEKFDLPTFPRKEHRATL